MSYPIAIAVPRPLCFAICARVAGQVDLQLTRAQRALVDVDRLVLIASSTGEGSPDWHKKLGAACRDAGVQPPDQRQLAKGVWRGIAQVRTFQQLDPQDPGRIRLGLQSLHLFRHPAPLDLLPFEERPLWLPDEDVVEALVDQWQLDDVASRVTFRRAS